MQVGNWLKWTCRLRRAQGGSCGKPRRLGARANSRGVYASGAEISEAFRHAWDWLFGTCLFRTSTLGPEAWLVEAVQKAMACGQGLVKGHGDEGSQKTNLAEWALRAWPLMMLAVEPVTCSV